MQHNIQEPQWKREVSVFRCPKITKVRKKKKERKIRRNEGREQNGRGK
jgi:hypothetical protein